MLARLFLCTFCLVSVASPAFAKDKVKPAALSATAEAVACAGVFGSDSSEALLIETYGKDNVVTGQVYGPEGMTYLASTVYPDDADRKMKFSWFNEDELTQLSSVELAPSQAGPGGVRIAMSVGEVQAINGEPFTIGGFWWDYGGYAGFETGQLAGPLQGECYLSLRFSPADDIPAAVDTTPIAGEVVIPSDEGLLELVDTRVVGMSIGYALEDAAE